MLMPKRTKFRKQMRGKMRGRACRGNFVAFGEFGLQALECKWITTRQIEAVRVVINRTFERAGKVHIRIFPDKPISKKPLGVRMGSGKGATEDWVCVVKPGRVMFEVAGVSEELAKEAFRRASHKLPIKVKMIKREIGGDVNEG